MMRRLLLTGFSFLLLCTMVQLPFAVAQESDDEPDDLFTLLEKATDELTLPPAIQTYAWLIMKKTYDSLSRDNMKHALEMQKSEFCNAQDANGLPLSVIECDSIQNQIVSLLSRERRIIELGRALQDIATSYELPIRSAEQGESATASAITNILNIWRVRDGSEGSSNSSSSTSSKSPDEKGNPKTASGMLLRTVLVDKDDTEAIAKDLKEAFEKLAEEDGVKDEQRIAAVWRYTAGVRLVRNERRPLLPPEEYEKQESLPERQYLFKKWPPVEDPLLQLWNLVKQKKIDPPLRQGETVLFRFSEEGLPENVEFWAYVEKNEKGEPDGDAGIRWRIPLEPVSPSLLKPGGQEPILGGAYPPEPVSRTAQKPAEGKRKDVQDGRTLCNDPVGRRGFLCRDADGSGIECQEEPTGDEDHIVLTSCIEKREEETNLGWCCIPGESDEEDAEGTCREITEKQCEKAGGELQKDIDECRENGCTIIEPAPARQTVSGADVCRSVAWQSEGDAAAFSCKIQIKCEASCDTSGEAGGYTAPKAQNGNIEVCISPGASQTPATYVLYHELVHAEQECGRAPGSVLYQRDAATLAKLSGNDRTIENQKCCQYEGEGYAAMCDMMEKDGVFLDENGERKESGSGIPFDAETCMEALRYAGCSSDFFGPAGFEGCATSRVFDKPFVDELVVAMQNNPAEVPVTCDDAVKKPDPRVTAYKEAIENVEQVCAPGNLTEFPSTIGNTMCFIGACVETSSELRRTIPGNAPFTVQDEAFPWDSDVRPLPDDASFLTSIPQTLPSLPVYRPGLLLERLDADLCQQVGLPPRSPSVLCVLEANRRLLLPVVNVLSIIQGLTESTSEQAMALDRREQLSGAIGIRLGTALYADRVGRFGTSFAEILKTAERLLSALKNTDFPVDMCPIGSPS